MPDDPKYKTWAGLAEAFEIFSRYDEGKFKTSAEHDVIYAGPNPKDVSTPDVMRLEQLGWHIEEEFDCFGYFT